MVLNIIKKEYQVNFQKLLNRYMRELQEFDLELFFHDDTFIEMLHYRELLDKNIDKLNADEQRDLYYLDEIVISYFNLYKNKKLTGYTALSFEVLSKIALISKEYSDKYHETAA